MAYAEGYKAFHLKFSPTVVARALTLESGGGGAAGAAPRALAPLYAMGLFHATPKRKKTSWGFVLGIFMIVKAVRARARSSPYPARSLSLPPTPSS